MLATGLVVDDAIVVLENIYTKIEDGMDPHRGRPRGLARRSSSPSSPPPSRWRRCSCPSSSSRAFTGRLFREFGVVVAGSVLISAFVSLTLTPMLCTRLLRKDKASGAFYRAHRALLRTA